MKVLAPGERSSLIKLATALNKGSEERKVILGWAKRAGALTPEQAADLGISFLVEKSPETATVTAISEEHSEVGVIESKRVTGKPCLDGFQIQWVESEVRNLGPLLYELMLDLVYPHPLMSDRAEVSSHAFRIWTYYLKNRPDIEHFQLDDPENTLTPASEDNCWQISSKHWGGPEWEKTPLSKAFRRKTRGTPVLDKCRNLGILEGFG